MQAVFPNQAWADREIQGKTCGEEIYAAFWCVDYFETFAPVAWKVSINVVLALAADQDLLMENVDVNTAFLYGKFHEAICMDQLDGFEDQQYRDQKYFLNKALYGTKQAEYEWNIS